MTERKSFMDEVDARIPAADFEAEYFPGGLVRVTIDLTLELVEQVMAVAKEQGWPRGEAFVALLALGIGALEEEKTRSLMERDDPPARNELEVLLRRMREMEMRYAVMKRRPWDFLKAYQMASLADGALRAEVAGLRRLAELDEFIRKNDYRFRDEPWGQERDAWLRALNALAGGLLSGVV